MPYEPVGALNRRPGEDEVRKTIMRVIAAHLRPSAGVSWRSAHFDFSNAGLADVDLIQTTFSGNARFDGTTFSGLASFGEATFSGDTKFNGATFSGPAKFDALAAARVIVGPGVLAPRGLAAGLVRALCAFRCRRTALGWMSSRAAFWAGVRAGLRRRSRATARAVPALARDWTRRRARGS
jgi:hypothetical protein